MCVCVKDGVKDGVKDENILSGVVFFLLSNPLHDATILEHTQSEMLESPVYVFSVI